MTLPKIKRDAEDNLVYFLKNLQKYTFANPKRGYKITNSTIQLQHKLNQSHFKNYEP